MKTVHAAVFKDMSGKLRKLEICVGDITKTSRNQKIDLLAISCFPDDYSPSPETIVGQLYRRGIYVAELARNKEHDRCLNWQTWISSPLPPEAPFGNIVCFEYGCNSGLNTVVGNIFRAVSDYALEFHKRDLDTLRIPLLSTGNQGANKGDMLNSIISHAYTHMRGCLPLKKVQIVIHQKTKNLYELLVNAGIWLEQAKLEWRAASLRSDPEYDYFVSYRRTDVDFIKALLVRLRELRPETKIFIDEQDLRPGIPWKPELIKNIYNSRQLICYVTDSYVESVECIDEFHAALCCSLSRDNFLRPLLNLSNRTIESLSPNFRRLNLIHARCPPTTIDQVLKKVFS